MCLEIKNGALFISDAHENDKRDGFYRFLLKIKSKEIDPPQLFLMGDMFDLLVGEVKYQRDKYKKYLDLIEDIGKNIEVFYFEGNHDFLLQNLFKNVKVFSFDMQPMMFKMQNQKVLLSHGDKYNDRLHTFYTSVIRNRFLVKILNVFDFLSGYRISEKIEKDLLKKHICSKIDNFQNIIENKIDKIINITADIIAEGHYHQNRCFVYKDIKYINFPSFACNQSYFIVQLSSQTKFIEIKGDA